MAAAVMGRPPLEAATPHRVSPNPLTAASPQPAAQGAGRGLARRPLPARAVCGQALWKWRAPTWTCSPESLCLSLPGLCYPSFRRFLALGPVLISPGPSLSLPPQAQAWSSRSPGWPRTSVHRPVLLRSRAGCSLRALSIPRSQSSAPSRPSHPQGGRAGPLVVCPPRPRPGLPLSCPPVLTGVPFPSQLSRLTFHPPPPCRPPRTPLHL